MKILFVIPFLNPWGFDIFTRERFANMDAWFIPIGICQLAAPLVRAGHEVELLDFRHVSGWAAVEEKLAAWRGDVAAFSFMMANRDHAVRAATLAKRYGYRTVAGGPYATVAPGDLVASGVFDYVVTGEGEEVFPGIVQRGETPTAPVVVHGHVANLDALPHPHFFPLYVERIMRPRGLVPLMISRCCPGRCTFCYPMEKSIFGETKYRSPESVFDELLAWQAVFPVREIMVYDNMFVGRQDLLERFLALKRRHGMTFIFGANARADYLTEARVRLLRECGCVQLYFGVESGSQRLLDRLHKGIRVEQYRHAAEWCRRHGISILINLLAGVPGETDDDFRATYRLVREMRPDQVAFNYLVPFPWTQLHAEVKAQGLLRDGLTCADYEMNLCKTRPLTTDFDLARAHRWERRLQRLLRRRERLRRWGDRLRRWWR